MYIVCGGVVLRDVVGCRANYVINPDGTRVILSASNRTQREAIAKQLLTPIPGMNPIAPNKQVGIPDSRMSKGTNISNIREFNKFLK